MEECDGEEWCASDCTGTAPPPCEVSGHCPEIEWVYIQGGQFNMGARNTEPPVHPVIVPSFEITKTEITTAMYRLCVEQGGCTEPNTGNFMNWSAPVGSREDHPMNGVSWYQAVAFARWVGGRLSSEAEWEYTARGGHREVIYPWGDTYPHCIYYTGHHDNNCTDEGTSPVCSTPRGNSLDGVCDMAGGLNEWTLDEYHSTYDGAPEDGSAWCSVERCEDNTSDTPRVIRTARSVNGTAYNLRVVARSSLQPNDRPAYMGIRVVRTPVAE